MTDLHKIANMPGYGTGKAARDRLAFRNEILALLPEPCWVQELTVSSDLTARTVPLAHFGYSSEEKIDAQIIFEPLDMEDWAFGKDAMDDARIVAAIVNAYALGILVRADAKAGDE